MREGIEPQISNPDLQNLSYLSDLEEIYPSLASGRNFTAIVRELPSPLRENLEGQSILSIALVPMFFGGVFGGFVGFDDCCSERIWATDEMHSLRAVAAGIGSALVRSRIEHSVKARADELSRLLPGHVASFSPEQFAARIRGIVLEFAEGSESTRHGTAPQNLPAAH